MLDALQNPIVIAGLVLVLLVLIAIPVLVRRRRAGQDAVLPPPELSQQVDYTSIPYEEPKTLGERLRDAPAAVKLLLGIVPLALIIAAFVVWQAFFTTPPTAQNIPPPPAPEITDVSATLASANRIVIDAASNLPDGTQVTAALLQSGQEFAWYNPESAQTQASGGQVHLVLERARDSQQPTRDQEYTVVLRASANNQSVETEPAKLTIPSIYVNDFFRDQAAAAPTTAPTTAPTAAPTAAPAAPTAAPAEPTAAPELKASVFNGGNIRRVPEVTNSAADILGQLEAGQEVVLLERTAAGDWYRVKAPAAEGWVSATLLTVDQAVAAQVPLEGQAPPAAGSVLTASVFNGGNVRKVPRVTDDPADVLDQINAGEPVTLLGKNASGEWFKITNARGVTGWVSATLLTIEDAVAAQVPVTQ